MFGNEVVVMCMHCTGMHVCVRVRVCVLTPSQLSERLCGRHCSGFASPQCRIEFSTRIWIMEAMVALEEPEGLISGVGTCGLWWNLKTA